MMSAVPCAQKAGVDASSKAVAMVGRLEKLLESTPVSGQRL